MSQLNVAFVTCSYDTGHEPVRDQVHGRIDQLRRGFDAAGPVSWSLWIVDDLPAANGFGVQALEACESYPDLPSNAGLRVVPLRSATPRPGGLKGQAILDGMQIALREAEPDVIVYLNLNLKVDARYAAPGIRAVSSGAHDVAIGTRSKAEGGLAEGRSLAGDLKSHGFSLLARALLPPLRPYLDSNAPMKVFTRSAAELLVRDARNPHVTMDCEWLVILRSQGLRVGTFPVVWTQRPGSRVPWHLAGQSLIDLIRIRRRWCGKGVLHARSHH